MDFEYDATSSVSHGFCQQCIICLELKSSGSISDISNATVISDEEILCLRPMKSCDDELMKMRKLLLTKRGLKSNIDLDLIMGGKSIEWTKAFEFAKISVANKSELEFIMKYPEVSFKKNSH